MTEQEIYQQSFNKGLSLRIDQLEESINLHDALYTSSVEELIDKIERLEAELSKQINIQDNWAVSISVLKSNQENIYNIIDKQAKKIEELEKIINIKLVKFKVTADGRYEITDIEHIEPEESKERVEMPLPYLVDENFAYVQIHRSCSIMKNCDEEYVLQDPHYTLDVPTIMSKQQFQQLINDMQALLDNNK